MAARCYPLESGGPDRLKITWRVSWLGRWKNICVLLDGHLVGSGISSAELAAGCMVFLPGGSILSIQQLGFGPFAALRVLVDGRELPGSAAESRVGGKVGLSFFAAADVLFVAGALDILLGLAAELLHVDFFTRAGIGYPSVSFGLLLITLGMFVRRRPLPVLWCAAATLALESGLDAWLAYHSGLMVMDVFSAAGIRLLFLAIVVRGLVSARQLTQ
jgi:hypothetical protein